MCLFQLQLQRHSVLEMSTKIAHKKSIMPTIATLIQSCRPKAPRAIHSIMPTDSIVSISHSHSFNHGWQIAVASLMPLLAVLIIFHRANCQHHSLPNHHVGRFSALRSPAACYTTAASQQRSPASIAAALTQAPPLTTAADDR